MRLYVQGLNMQWIVKDRPVFSVALNGTKGPRNLFRKLLKRLMAGNWSLKSEIIIKNLFACHDHVINIESVTEYLGPTADSFPKLTN